MNYEISFLIDAGTRESYEGHRRGGFLSSRYVDCDLRTHELLISIYNFFFFFNSGGRNSTRL